MCSNSASYDERMKIDPIFETLWFDIARQWTQPRNTSIIIDW
jgi:hypothetical protein